MNNITNTVGLIVLGLNSDYAMLMVENDGLYSLPEASIESLTANNIVEGAMELAESLNLTVEQKSLAYVVKQKVPDSDEIIITYYFIVAVIGENKVPKGYEWLLDVKDKMDKSIYPEKLIKSIEEHLKEGWLMGNIEVISD